MFQKLEADCGVEIFTLDVAPRVALVQKKIRLSGIVKKSPSFL
jgi:hypothetical protein